MPQSWKEVRVFISSTFRDMQAERDHLVRFVFPRLREELLKRRIHLVDVDLRWGVTADQDAFDLCKDEIDHCRPRTNGLQHAVRAHPEHPTRASPRSAFFSGSQMQM